MEIKDGGSAFPCSGYEQWAPDGGMTLRDFFAAKAMQAIYTRLGGSPSAGNNHDGGLTYIAEASYSMADAMIAARREL
ncbi:hypothetical protein [Pseudomonas sp. CCI2.4]|uniref:hypothetical protein n=1 Tax=Pseudomonas sp. CCI2.4 TaxID=3048617 RepID=UPI002B22D0DE|nr:hypothetical protein [Pseudomonas sp. CCI2.4]MEB0133443.1 hypothetical protein [Pseudomonas sp. CCI2.4]